MNNQQLITYVMADSPYAYDESGDRVKVDFVMAWESGKDDDASYVLLNGELSRVWDISLCGPCMSFWCEPAHPEVTIKKNYTKEVLA